MPTPDPTTTKSLARLLDLDDAAGDLWMPDELGAVLEHQLNAPLATDLGHLEPGLDARLAAISPDSGPPVRTFRDLFTHPHPPVELLESTKRFAKHCRNHARNALPVEVASVLYLLSIVVALRRCGRRISGLDSESLRYGVDWARRQPWLDETTRNLLREPYET